MERSVRHRVNVSTSVKGIKTWDATVEITCTAEVNELDYETERHIVIALSDALSQELDKRYPPEVK